MSSEPSIRERAAKALCDAHHHNESGGCPDETCGRSEHDADVVLAVVADWLEAKAAAQGFPRFISVEGNAYAGLAAVLRSGVSEST